MSNTWCSLGLHKWIEDQLIEMKIDIPTDIQKQCIPEILLGRDCIGCAKTGSGKTAVFALPVLQKLSEDPYGVFALVLTPTRELATQIFDQFCAFGKSIRVKSTLIVGGESCTLQSIKLSQKPHIVVATPGRLANILRENPEYFHFKKLQFLILDEVDALLDSNDMQQDIESILNILPPPSNRQTLAFSATSEGIIDTLRNSLKSTAFCYVSESKTATVDELNEFYLLAPMIAKDAYLVHLLRTKLGLIIESHSKLCFVTTKNLNVACADRQSIVFTASCWQCHLIAKILIKLGFKCSVLHSALTQSLRNQSLSKFRSRQTRILVATSLAGRGLDIPCVDLVINFSLPYSTDEYIHHVGRTARAGRSGTSISFVAPYELDRLIAIENTIGKKLKEFIFEDEKEAEKLVKSCALLRREITTELYHNEDSKLNRKIERKKKSKLPS
ncbi:hypothetical protein HZS_1113 [Henneguya salminicola]|nr:hypothetical protein HZS_1113 [Henneguya salminicola]